MSSFRICPECKSYNTLHVEKCYKCSAILQIPSTVSVPTIESEEARFRPTPNDDRQTDRKVVGVLGAVLENNGEIRHDVMIEDVSSGGLLFHSNTIYHEFDRFFALVPLEGENYVVEAIVKRCDHIGFTQWPYATGVEFVDPPKEFKNHVRKLCAGVGLSTYSFA
jgi:hypothetical protein